MNSTLKFKELLAATLLCSISASAAAGTAENISQDDASAPKATAAETDLSFRDIPFLEKAFIDATPVDLADSIPVGELGVDGGDKDMIIALAQEIAGDQHGLFDSMLIAQNGKLVFESYYRRGRVDLPHFQASATKSYTSLAIGRAIQMGYLTMADLDRPVASFLAELDPRSFVDGAESITLGQALSMGSGIRIDSEEIDEINEDPAIRGQAQVQAYFEQTAPITKDSPTFQYGNDPVLVMQILEAVVPGTAMDFIANELLGKLGITNYNWLIANSGLPEAGSRSSLTSRDMLKIGTLAINNGRWNGEQLIPEDFIAKSTNKVIHPVGDWWFLTDKVTNIGYGYYWWQTDLTVGDKTYLTRSAAGGGSQYIMLIEDLGLVIVITAHDRDDQMLHLVADRILPAFVAAEEPIAYEMPRTQVVPIKDTSADRQYELYIKLPEGYAENTEARYPVIYATDAKIQLDMLSGSTEFLMPNVILVGISWQTDLGDEAENASRFRDFTTVTSSNQEFQARYQFGQASNHLSFIREKVIRFVEENYRTKPDERTYFGYSLGGAFGAYALFEQPDSFRNYIFGSPAFSRRSADHIDALEARMAPHQQDMDVNVFVSIGELEESEMETTRRFMSVLCRRNEAGLSLAGLEIIEDSDHTTAFPEAAIRGVKWLSQLTSE